MKISTLRTLFHTQLSLLYEKREIDAIFFIYIENKYKIKRHHYFLNPDYEIAFEYADMKALVECTPIQYIIGKTTFCNLLLYINPAVLIPRPETEELVGMIVNESRRQKAESRKQKAESRKETRILDIGTGSGAIAIALAKKIKNATIWATDISKKALEVAKKNATNHNAEITFLYHNILKDGSKFLPAHLDIIVSNPPYIPLNERNNLHKNVTDHEPSVALFVPNKNPLVFYNAIICIAKKNLRKGGTLYFETHEKFHSELEEIFAKAGFNEIEFCSDMNNKPRFAKCKKL